jgi:hypothetical protein
MKSKSMKKPADKAKKPEKASYEEPMRPKKPNSNSDKGAWQDKGNYKSTKLKK